LRAVEISGRGTDIAADLIRGGIGVIAITTTFLPVDARRVSSSIPVIMAASTDPPLAAGRKYYRLYCPSRPRLRSKADAFLNDTVPHLLRVAYFGTKGEWDLPNAEALRAAAEHLGLTLKLTDYTGFNCSDAVSR
jgi:hypothetical protein